jgi:uncharacterized protein GlcG (DUF336 family)
MKNGPLRRAESSRMRNPAGLLGGLACVAALALSCGGNAGESAPPAEDDSSDPTVRAPVLLPEEVRSIMQLAAGALDQELAVAVTDRRGVILGAATTFQSAGSEPAFNFDSECAALECPAAETRIASPMAEPAGDCLVVELAVQLARTGAFFSADQTPLTSRSIRFLSGEHFPAGVRNAAAAALFGIENTNRGCSFDAETGPAESSVPRAKSLAAVIRDTTGGPPLSCQNGDDAGDRCGCTNGIITFPGGVPIFKNGRMVGGIGVALRGVVLAPDAAAAFDYPGLVLRRTDQNSDFELAEFAARAFAGDHVGLPTLAPKGLPGVCASDEITPPACCKSDPPCFFGILPAPPPLPFDPVIFVDGIEIPEVALNPRVFAATGSPLPLTYVIDPMEGSPADGPAEPAPTGWLFGPADATDDPPGAAPLGAAEVESIIGTGVGEALEIRAAIRLPLETRTSMVLAVSDTNGALLGLFRMNDATVFSIDVAVAKSRNVAYFSSPTIDPIDTSDCPALDSCGPEGAIPAGTAITNRTLGFGSQPFFPSGIDGSSPGPYRRVFIEDSAVPCRNGGEPPNGRQNGIVFFPGSAPLYRDGVLVGGLGVSGDGVEQDDIVTFAGARAAPGFEPPASIRADQLRPRGVRLPYLKFNRRPEQ